MSTVSKLAIFALGLWPVLGIAQTGSSPWRFIPPDAKALVSVDWSRIRTSHIGAMLRERWVDAAAMPGSEFLNDADRFVISQPGGTGDDRNVEPPMLLVVTGHFDLARIRTVLAQHRAKPQQYNSFQVYRPQGKDAKDMAFMLFDSRTILIGDSRSIFASLDRVAFPAGDAAAGSLLTRVADMDATYDAWIIVNTPGALVGDRLTALLHGSDVDAATLSLEFGLALRDGLAADFTLMLGSESAAKQIISELSRVVKLAVKDKLGEPALLDLEKKIKFTTQGQLAKITVRLTPQELEKNAQIFAASRQKPAAGFSQVRPVVKQDPAPPSKPEKKVIRIEGLDGGPREIPYQENQ